MTTTTPPAVSEALVFYTAAGPLVERLLALARAWRDRAPADSEAITAHGEMVWLAIRCDLRLNRYRATAEPGAPHSERSERCRR